MDRYPVPGRSAHSGRLERWLGADTLSSISDSMKNWPGPPIALAGVPGKVWAESGGGFVGNVRGGWFESAIDVEQRLTRRMRMAAFAGRQRGALSGLNQLLQSVNSVGSDISIRVRGLPTGSLGTTDLFYAGGIAGSGTAAAAAPGGTAYNSSHSIISAPTGAGNSNFFAGGVSFTANSAAGCGGLLLYDRLFAVRRAALSTAAETVTGVPTRYQNTSPNSIDYVGGNFAAPVQSGSTAAGNAFNFATCQYTNQSNATANFASRTGSIAITSPGPVPIANAGQDWFLPLAAGDSGVKNISQIQTSGQIATNSNIEVMIGHPIAIIPTMLGVLLTAVTSCINSAFSVTPILSDACLSALSLVTSNNGVGITAQFKVGRAL